MTTLAIIGAIAMIVVSILIIVVVSLQEGKGDGITALAGVSAFLTDSNDRSANAKLSKLTKILAIIFVVITLLVYILQYQTITPQEGRCLQRQAASYFMRMHPRKRPACPLFAKKPRNMVDLFTFSPL